MHAAQQGCVVGQQERWLHWGKRRGGCAHPCRRATGGVVAACPQFAAQRPEGRGSAGEDQLAHIGRVQPRGRPDHTLALPLPRRVDLSGVNPGRGRTHPRAYAVRDHAPRTGDLPKHKSSQSRERRAAQPVGVDGDAQWRPRAAGAGPFEGEVVHGMVPPCRHEHHVAWPLHKQGHGAGTRVGSGLRWPAGPLAPFERLRRGCQQVGRTLGQGRQRGGGGLPGRVDRGRPLGGWRPRPAPA
mmetsp:Transcript_26243/g.98781  ORF Transcript_26243/g.98781 Transcript_26243/m.98781 type:complete len:241 (-) Transcript_26243:975-1697(-)